MARRRMIQRYPNDVKDWWAKTLDDLRWAENNLEGEFYTQVCFICQQVVEKALKTFLLSQNVVVEKIHKLTLLLKQAFEKDNSFIEWREKVKILDRYYLETRYPTFSPKGDYSEKEAQEALEITKEIVEFVEKKIKTS